MTTEATHTTAPATTPLYRRISRGLLRFWAVATVPWIVGVALLYVPPNSGIVPCAIPDHGFGRAFFFLDCVAGRLALDRVPLALPQGHGGLQIRDLTPPQQDFVYVWDGAVAVEMETKSANRDDLALVQAILNARYGHPGDDLNLVPVAELGAADAARYRRVWADPLRTAFSNAAWGLAEMLGLPLLVLVGGAIVLHAAVWVWGGFRAGA